jgi:large subunit ribosomal protein L10
MALRCFVCIGTSHSSREELLGMLAATWMAPIRNLAVGIDALRRKKEEEA